MNRTGVFFEGRSSRHLYNTKLTPETLRLSPGLKEKYYDENLVEKMLRSTRRWLGICILPSQNFFMPISCHFSSHVHRRSGLRVEEKGTSTL